MPDQGQLGRAIRELRHERGMTGEQLAFAAQVDLAHLNRAENHGRNLTWATFVGVAGALDISASELVMRAEEVAARDRAETGGDDG
jgi:transcriptional regulator with XRE-family HTH domain